MRVHWFAAGAALLLFASACGKKKEEAGRETKVDLAKIEGLAAIPRDATAVAGMNVGKLAESPLVKRAVQQMLVRDAELDGRITELSRACGIDPVKDVRSVIIAIGQNPEDSLLVASGNFSAGKLTSCVSQYATKDGSRLLTIEVGGRNAYKLNSADGRETYFSFGSSNTVIMATTERWLDRAMSPGGSITEEPEFAELLKRVDTSAAGWGVGRVTDSVGKGLVEAAQGKVSAAPRAMFGSLEVPGALKAELGVEMANASDAKALVSLAKAQLKTAALLAQQVRLGPLVNKIALSSDGNTAFFRLELTRSEVREFAAVLDTEGGEVQDAGPASEDVPAPEAPAPQEGKEDEQRDAAPAVEAPVRQQGKVDQ